VKASVPNTSLVSSILYPIGNGSYVQWPKALKESLVPLVSLRGLSVLTGDVSSVGVHGPDNQTNNVQIAGGGIKWLSVVP